MERACGLVQHADILTVEEGWRWCTVDSGIVIYLYYRLLNLVNKNKYKLHLSEVRPFEAYKNVAPVSALCLAIQCFTYCGINGVTKKLCLP